MSDIVASSRAERYRMIPDAERNQIVAKRLHGLSLREVAKQHHCDPVTVWRICKDIQQAHREVAQDWRKEQAELAVTSVNRALVDDSDTYKSAGIAVQALKGLGVYAQDNQTQVNVANWLGSKPEAAQVAAQMLTTTKPSADPTPQDTDPR